MTVFKVVQRSDHVFNESSAYQSDPRTGVFWRGY